MQNSCSGIPGGGGGGCKYGTGTVLTIQSLLFIQLILCVYISICYLLLQRSLAEVEWRATGLISTCRIGHKGNVMSK